MRCTRPIDHVRLILTEIITGVPQESNATTTSFTVTTQFVTHKSTSPTENSPGITFSDTTVISPTRTTTKNASTTNTAIFSTSSTTTPATSAPTSETSFSSNATSASSITAVTSETDATTNAYRTVPMTTTEKSSTATVPIDTTITKNTTRVITTDSPRTRSTAAETSTITLETPRTERVTTETETTRIVATTKITTDVDTTTRATDIPCENFNYVARDASTGVACIRVNMTVQINLRYTTNDSQVNGATLTVPKKAKTSGVCGDKTAEMTLSWKDAVENLADGDIQENNITFYYTHDDSRYFLDSTSVNVYLDNNNFPNAQGKRMKGDTTGRHLRLFPTLMKDGPFIRQLGTKINVGDEMDVVISDINFVVFTGCSGDASARTDEDHIVRAGFNNSTIVAGVIGTIVLILAIFFLIWCKKKKNVARSEPHLP
ncbi:cell wall protein DAN4 [Harpegnathos saltator]|uniref:Lysosome-associated membrane glycoprotein 2-like luminal domain-containing protein n=1 Tax=Harpegnathos saltator TaxID=610380 RepID=E2BVF0_HARSA|nr:cell wall protein DAN4 [Harpegnathos saltator]EFN80326.1 hypothetical protein EAI_07046 [Harpegnathos saltator]